LWLPVVTLAQTGEYNIKAVFIERFTRYIEWPEESAVSDTSQPFVLGIIGKNPFGSVLEEIYSTQRIRKKKVIIRYISKLDEIKGCNLLFLSESEKKELSKILSFSRKRPILTVSDTKDFAGKGVAINFVIIEGKIKFEINKSAIDNVGLKVSSQLLKLAILVGKKEGQ